MKRFIVITFFIISSLCASACNGDSAVVKRYRLKDKISFKSVVKLTYNNIFSFYFDGKEYIEHMIKTYEFIEKYQGFKDTLYVKIQSTYDSIKNEINYSLSIKDSFDSMEVQNFSDTILTKPKFSVFSFYFNSFGYIVQKPLRKKKLLIFNELTKRFETKIIKEKYSYYCNEFAAGGGWRWKIKDSNIVFYNVMKWIS